MIRTHSIVMATSRSVVRSVGVGVFAAMCALSIAGCKSPAEAEPAPVSAEPSASAGLDVRGEPAPTTLAATHPTAAAAPSPEPALAPAEPAVVQTPTPPEPPAPTIPEAPYRALILGDSLAATGPGALLERRLAAHPHIEAFRRGKSASGLARPDFFDWMAEGKRQVELHDPDLVIVVVGGNDGQDLTRLSGRDRPRVGWKDEAWADAYRERVDDFLQVLRSGGHGERKILWIGLPTMGLTSLERKLTLIRDVQQNAVEALGDDAIYLDTIAFSSDADGDMRTHADLAGGKKDPPLRTEDRIHFTMAGSRYFADHVYPAVLDALALPDVEDSAR